ncbi:hypothetical protein HK405_006548, partial [Cladochytrium tenue]
MARNEGDVGPMSIRTADAATADTQALLDGDDDEGETVAPSARVRAPAVTVAA